MGQQNSYMTLIGVHEMHNIMYEVCRCVTVCKHLFCLLTFSDKIKNREAHGNGELETLQQGRVSFCKKNHYNILLSHSLA